MTLATPSRWWVALLIVMLFTMPRASQRATWQEMDPGYWEPSNLPQMGLATYYSPGMMEYVTNYRQQHGQLPPCEDCVGTVALLRAGDIGRKVWLQPPGGELAGPFLVVDCAQTEDVQPLLDRNWAVDVSFEVGQAWGMNAPLDGVIVWPDPSEKDNPPRPLPTQFYINPRDVVISMPTSTPGVDRQALPTRLPARRATSPILQSGGSSRTVITTPTPPGGSSISPDVAVTPAPAPPGAAASSTPAIRVAFARAGGSLLNSSTAITGTLRLLPPTAYLAATATPFAPTMPRRAAATRSAGSADVPPTSDFLHQVWKTLLQLLTP